ncbi:hypothetical protein, partial [Nitrosomonas oligotropha]|uniref:hypothetical protein n=1 Tax=Nitrosomonas oligotropha TaxID=42354 RepID=UPI001C409935
TDRTSKPTGIGGHHLLEWSYQTLDVRQKDYARCTDFIRFIGYPADCQEAVCSFYWEGGIYIFCGQS